MGTTKLDIRPVEKPWGRTKLPAYFQCGCGKRIGEIWFTAKDDLPLLAKYLFTSERLSVQVHPDDRQARALSFPRGKSECWYILDAEPGATIGLGLAAEVPRDELRRSALDGSIEDLIHWRPVQPGDFFVVEPGTIHAVGANISLIEFQQNSDVTFRLYDYGRPRELHLNEALAVAYPGPYRENLARNVNEEDECVLVDGPHFSLVKTHRDTLCDRRRWILPLSGLVRAESNTAGPGECLLVDAGIEVEVTGGSILVGAVFETAAAGSPRVNDKVPCLAEYSS